MPDLIIFAETQVGFAPALLESFLIALAERRPYGRVRVCVTSRDRPLWVYRARFLLGYLVKALFNRSQRKPINPAHFTTVTAVARKHGIEIVEPVNFDVNDPEFVRKLKMDSTPLDALCLGCLQIWHPALLGCFRRAVNYHNGYLPDYKGLWATRWSIYRGEAYSGYAFHLMDTAIDTGPILLRGRIPIPSNTDPRVVENEKLAAARGDARALLDAMLAETIEAQPQHEAGSYFSHRDTLALRHIEDPSAITAEEFERRLRCFPPLETGFNGETLPVTAVRPANSATHRFKFTTADGVALEATRLNYLPPLIFRVTRALGLQKRKLSP